MWSKYNELFPLQPCFKTCSIEKQIQCGELFINDSIETMIFMNGQNTMIHRMFRSKSYVTNTEVTSHFVRKFNELESAA